MRVLVFLALIGCSNPGVDPDGSPDAVGGGDAAVVPDARATGTVQVVVRSRGTMPGRFQTGARVFASSPDRVLGAETLTDASGEATLDITAGDTVTVIEDDGIFLTSNYLTSVLDVRPGDRLELGDAPATNRTPVGSPMMITWPPIADATFYNYYWPCGYGFTTEPQATITHYVDCEGATTELLVYARAVTSTTATVLHQAGVPWIDDGTYAITTNWEEPTSLQVSVDGIDPRFYSALLSMSHSFGDLHTYDESFASSSGPVVAGTPAVPDGAAARTVRYTLLSHWGPQGGAATIGGGTTTYAGSSRLLRWLAAGAVTAYPFRAIWLEESEPTDDADVLYLRISIVVGLEFTETYYWQVFMPPDASPDFDFPPLPDDFVFAPPYADFDGVAVYASDSVDSWQQVKAVPEYLLRCPDRVTSGPPFPEVRFSRYGEICP